jgi:hypothetical protein
VEHGRVSLGKGNSGAAKHRCAEYRIIAQVSTAACEEFSIAKKFPKKKGNRIQNEDLA